ncbi:MAG: NAD-dependent epimerase/dehydratase family protein [Desulfocapsaceae bacterium]|nr:NAD-dependent epimerase/dehydratase family protein [Desulfocapsaceae bacterium]
MKTALVTGGGGFIGRALVRALLARGITCYVAGRNPYPEIEKMGALCFCGDIRDRGFLEECSRGVDTLFHTASLTGIWGPWSHYYSVNVLGTENVLHACRKNSIARLIYTSTPSVVFDRHDICNGDETLPYPQTFLCHYAQTKALAERMVLQANGDSLSTCAIRPHLVWGPGDPHLIPRLLERGRNGQLKIVGRGENLVDISYVDNVAHAHLLAADNLPGIAAGKAYFVNQGEPVDLWKWINELFERTGIAILEKKVPFIAAYGIGMTLEIAYKILALDREPGMTRFLAEQLAKSHYFSIARAREELGYIPLVNNEEGMRRLVISLQSL